MNRPRTTPCECPQSGWCERHGCRKPPHLHRLCRTSAAYFDLWEQAAAEPGSLNAAAQSAPAASSADVAVAVICHNYGRFLAECLDSVLAQTRPPAEIVVIDDSSTDETARVAARYASRGVRLVRIEAGHVHRARQAGLEHTSAEILCFLDADDHLAPDYIARGLPLFARPHVAVVYSDVEHTGRRHGRSRYPARFDAGLLQRDNYLHAGSLVRRTALEHSRAFDASFDPALTQGDWFLWRRVLREPWTAARQPSTYYYRRHETNWSITVRPVPSLRDYADYAGLPHEDVTLFVPLSGREHCWPQLSEFLDRQTWPREQTRLILLDTSQDTDFSRRVRDWIAGCDYPDVRHVLRSVGDVGLADANRRRPDIRAGVVRALQQILATLLELSDTEYLWIVEDDIRPPNEACSRLIRGFDKQTASVAGVYPSRFQDKFVVWSRPGEWYSERGNGIETVGGNGFGCTMLRRSVAREVGFGPFGGTADADTAFYLHLKHSRWQARVHWDVVCRHEGAPSPDSGQDPPPMAQTPCECPQPGWCERHGCRKPRHLHNLCRNNRDYFDLWEEQRQNPAGSAQEENGAAPGLLRRAANLGQAVVRHAADGARKVSDDVYEARLAVCRECPHCDVARLICREKRCGCRLEVKARWRSESCPLGHWPDPPSAEDPTTGNSSAAPPSPREPETAGG